VLIAVHCVQRCKDTWFLHLKWVLRLNNTARAALLNRRTALTVEYMN
jgi:hypothetical protein